MSHGPHIRLQMTSDPRYLSGARELVSAVARRLGFTEEGAGQVALAVDEALCNIIRHGYDRRTDKPIWLSLEALETVPGRPRGLTIVLEDEARQVNPETIKSRDLDEVRPGGLGVHIIRQVMDDVRYERREGTGGMRLTMTKRIAEEQKPTPTAPGARRGCAAAGGGGE